MIQPVKKLKLPDGPRTIAYRGICRVVTSDPILLGAGVRFRTRSGDPLDAAPVAAGSCPLVCLSPVPRDDKADTERTKLIPMEIAVAVFVAGTCIDDALNLWDAIQTALDLRKPFEGTTVGDYLRCSLPRLEANGDPVSIIDYRLARPAFEPWTPASSGVGPGPDGGSGLISGVGTIKLAFPTRR